MTEPTIYKPSIYNGPTVYNNGGGGGGGGGGGSLSLFYTDGTLTEDNKNKATPGGLSSRNYDSTFYKTSDNLFHVTTSDVSWISGFSPPNYITGKFEIKVKLKNIFSGAAGCLLSFGGNRFVEFGYPNDNSIICVGFSIVNNSWTVITNYESTNWEKRNSLTTDHYWANPSIAANKIIEAKVTCHKKSDRWNFIMYVDDEEVYDVDILTTSSFGNYVGTRFIDRSSEFLEFGYIDIKQINE